MNSGKPRHRGFTYLTALLLVAAVGFSVVSIAELWSHARQREKEAELIWVGNQFKQAIGLYYERSPGSVKRYPEKLEDLLEDRRYLSTQRYLRRMYADPISGKTEWGVIPAPGGGVMGVHSKSAAAPIKTHAGARYSDWRFLHEPPAKLSAQRP